MSVLTPEEETKYLTAAQAEGEQILRSYDLSLAGIRATVREEQPIRQSDPFLLRDVTTILLERALRPEESNRLRREANGSFQHQRRVAH